MALSFIITACSADSSPEQQLQLPLRISAKLSGSDALFTAEIYENGCDIYFDTSHSLALTELHFSDQGNTAASGDFVREVKAGTFPAQEALVKAVRLISRNQESGVKTENGIKYAIDEMTIMVYYDKDTGILSGIGTEEGGRKFEFSIVTLEPYEIQSNGEG